MWRRRRRRTEIESTVDEKKMEEKVDEGKEERKYRGEGGERIVMRTEEEGDK